VFDRVHSIASKRIYLDEIAKSPGRFVALFRGSMAHEFERAGVLNGAAAIWSMWAGYLQNESGMRLTTFLDKHQIPMVIHHTSGHATLADLRRFADAIDADRVVPIHTAAPEAFVRRLRNAEIQKDGEWWLV
jgi:ribonuclease J